MTTQDPTGSALDRARAATTGWSDRVRDWWADAPGWQRWSVYGLALLVAIIAPADFIASFMSPYTDWTSLLFNPIGTFVLLAVGLNIVVGHAGLLDLGFVAFYAIGAYTLAYLGTKHGWPFWPSLILGVFLAAVSGVILGAPTLRLRGDYLAIVTLGFGEIVRITATNTNEIGGARGITPIPHPPSFLGVEFKLDPLPYYYFILFVIVLVIVFSMRLQRSRVGRAWTAIREDEDAAELMGVPTFKFKLLVFASKVIFIAPTNFPFILSATILAAVLLGGAGNLPGVILGAFLIAWLPERFRGFADYRILVFGAALVLTMTLRPQGLLPSRQRSAELKTSGTSGLAAAVPDSTTGVPGEDAPVEAGR
jgi:branched-chain amino acid transport system permease protein